MRYAVEIKKIGEEKSKSNFGPSFRQFTRVLCSDQSAWYSTFHTAGGEKSVIASLIGLRERNIFSGVHFYYLLAIINLNTHSLKACPH